MNTLYAYMRVSDDLADEPGVPAEKRQKLADWRAALAAALTGSCSHPLHPALVETVRRYQIPPRFLFEVLDGIETDLGPVRMANFAELYVYCYRVASAVGLACVRVWGTRPGATDAETDPPAEAMGIAFQLTNILRDLSEDRSRDRIYLPEDELAAFKSPPERWLDPDNRRNFLELMRFQAERARGYYRRGAALASLLTPDGRAIFHVMCTAYRGLLDEIERSNYDVFTRRVRLPRWRKLSAWATGWLVKRGLW